MRKPLWLGRGVKGTRKRRPSIQKLEGRRLLAAEGVGVDISQSFTTTGLTGTLSSTIKWGDNTESAGTVTGSVDNNGPLSIKFQYMGSFFNDPARRTLLENAAASVIERFSDDLEPIQPTGFLNWTAVTSNPQNGSTLRINNLSVAANELVIYVGDRNFTGNKVAEGFPGYAETSFTGSYTQEQIDQINAFHDTIQYRGESGAKLANPTDIGMWGGYISFDSDTNWHFGATKDGLDDDEVDFSTVVVHEMMHVLGFGVSYGGNVNSSYDTVTTDTAFIGAKARALYGGNVPLENSQHFADEVESNGQQSVITEDVAKGERKVLTPLDLAALDDIGWTVRTAPNATVTGSHVYADNPDTGSTFPVEVILRGSEFGEVTQSLTQTVTNTPPTLSVPPNQTLEVNRPFTISNIGEISDPGFSSSAAGTTESFTYSINWGDGDTDAGDATIDRNGNGTLTTFASFDGSHTFEQLGTYTVSITVTDDDGGSDTESFSVTVVPQPELILSLSQSSIVENDGPDAATLTVTRSGPARSTDQTISLVSNDTGEATVVASVTILANQTSATATIDAVDDTLLDGLQTVTFTASASGVDSGEVNLDVHDAESLSAQFIGGSITEADSTSVVLQVARSNSDVDQDVIVMVTGGLSSQLTFDRSIAIPGGQTSVTVPLTPVQDDQPELDKLLQYSFASPGYAMATASVEILDDEPPLFQNPNNAFDADGGGAITPNDILTVINQLAIDGSNVVLDPETRPFEGLYYDVDGNDRLTPNDILEVINELARIRTENPNDSPNGELIADAELAHPLGSFLVMTDDDDDDDAEAGDRGIARVVHHGL